ncbi:hypothetical protein P5V43_21325 [Mycobacteroides abscessus subsp. bolletii]|uniref:hypothetical protein n=1 Tax=Mycobacteroides abscessus TaxID=36809 RepID=UPI00266CBA20|nr:hypothetical protein [Mycobacteroides abscessus]MDO3129651.1 hypothetical protein [Mycobacteroides abscessus subsp. bolletii]
MFVDDLRAHVPELAADRIDEAAASADRPSPAYLDALRVLLDMKPRQVADHPGPTVALPVSDPAGVTAWSTVLELSTHRPNGWTLVGGQMVHLLAWEHGEQSPRITTDADVVLDIRAYPKALLEVTERLLRTGYVEDGVNPEGLGHRYRNRTVTAASIDILLPEGLGDTAKYPTATGARTISVPGSIQALERSLKRSVIVGGTRGFVIRPDVHAAMVLKAAAHRAERGKVGAERHLRDLAVLVSLYARHYPESELRERLTNKDRERIADGLGALLPNNPIWRTVSDGQEARDLVVRALRTQ